MPQSLKTLYAECLLQARNEALLKHIFTEFALFGEPFTHVTELDLLALCFSQQAFTPIALSSVIDRQSVHRGSGPSFPV